MRTLFTCPAHLDLAQNWVTWMVVVEDAQGQLADCVVFGHDPQGFNSGIYDPMALNPMDPMMDMRPNCTVLP